MKSKGFRTIFFFIIITLSASSQSLTGYVISSETGSPLSDTDVYNQTTGELQKTNFKGYYKFEKVTKGKNLLTVFAYQYQTINKEVEVDGDTQLDFQMSLLSRELPEVVISQVHEEVFGLDRLKPVEGTAIYAGKKTEVVLLDQMTGNIAANNPRQIYAQVVGLNIYENADAGLQLNIGGRGLDPNRTSNFNTRQNGYDISADVLGYPESYYTPPAEALREIQVIRGAASLQYGTQFGGLINFRMKKPAKYTPIEWTSRQSVGSYGLFTSFNSLSGTKGKWSYYTYFNYKKGDGFRQNSSFSSNNAFAHIGYQLTNKTKLSLEATYLHYLAKQAGGLTDTQFHKDPTFTNRKRNWFSVDWKLISAKVTHKFDHRTELSVSLFGLNATRKALGYRGIPGVLNQNPVSVPDEQVRGKYIYTRDLISGNFRNWGAEARLLTRYRIGNQNAIFLIGSKYYRANNTSQQGPGNISTDAKFDYNLEKYNNYPNQSNFKFPNRNFSIFGEHIFYLNKKLSVTPGFRLEYIRTESIGLYKHFVFNQARKPLLKEDRTDNRTLSRSFLLLGTGISYRKNNAMEFYTNISQNYRSVTFSDIRVVNPTFIVDENITDEKGYTADIGMRGKWKETISYDIGVFGLKYSDRIGTIFNNRAQRVRKNIGDAFIYGLESFLEWNMVKSLGLDPQRYRIVYFVNSAVTESEYVRSEENNVQGRKVEFIPQFNLKTGLKFGYKNLLGSLQFTYLSQQYTDAENSAIPHPSDHTHGTKGEIPAYHIMDLSLSYTYKKWKIETGINNLLDHSYFTRRATGYPGPGIIPSDPQTFYLALQLKLTAK